jgi:hypothetical protein
LYSVKRSEDAIARCDIAILVLDAESGILEQDKKVADLITEARKACILVVNKWDLVAESVRAAREQEIEQRRRRVRHEGQSRPLTTLAEFGSWVQSHLFFLDYAPVVFTSAHTGFQLDRLLEAVRYVAAQLRQRIPCTTPSSAANRSAARAIASNSSTPPRLAPRLRLSSCSSIVPTFSPMRMRSISGTACAKPSATKAVRSCCMRVRARKPWNRSRRARSPQPNRVANAAPAALPEAKLGSRRSPGGME